MPATNWKKIKYLTRRGSLVLINNECSRCFHILSNKEEAYKRNWFKSGTIFETEIVCKNCYNKMFI